MTVKGEHWEYLIYLRGFRKGSPPSRNRKTLLAAIAASYIVTVHCIFANSILFLLIVLYCYYALTAVANAATTKIEC